MLRQFAVTRPRKNIFDTLHVWAPFSFADKLPDYFVTTHHTEYARWTVCPEWWVVDVSKPLIEALSDLTSFNAQNADFYHGIDAALGDKSKGYATRCKSILDGIVSRAVQLSQIVEDFRSSFVGKAFSREGIEDLVKTKLSLMQQYDMLKQKHRSEQHRFSVSYDDDERQAELIVRWQQHIRPKRSLSWNEIRAMPIALFDIEKPLFRYDNATITTIACIGYDGRPVEKQLVTSNYLRDSAVEGFEIIGELPSEKEVVETSRDFVRKYPRVGAFNLPYDAIESRESEGDFSIGEEEDEPKVKVSLEFFRRIGIKHKLPFDFLRESKVAYSYLPNQKYQTVMNLVRERLGRPEFKKDITYEQQERLQLFHDTGDPTYLSSDVVDILAAEAGTVSKLEALLKIPDIMEVDARVLAKYPIHDAVGLLEFMEFYEHEERMQDYEFMANHFLQDIVRVMHSPNNINDQQKRVYFTQLGVFRDEVYIPTTQFQALQDAGKQKFRSFRNKKIVDGSVDGLVQNVFKAYIPEACRPLVLVNFREARGFYEYMDAHRANKQRFFFLSQYQDALARYLNADFGLYLRAKDALSRGVKRIGVTEGEFQDACSTIPPTGSQRKFLENLTPAAQDILDQAVARKPDYTEEHFFGLYKKLCAVPKKISKVGGNYRVSVEKVTGEIEGQAKSINQFLTDNNLQVVAKQGKWIYVIGNKEALTREDCPVILVDQIDRLYMGGRPLYRRFGYASGLDIDKSISHIFTRFELRLYSEMLDLLLDGRIGEAESLAGPHLKQLATGGVGANDLVTFFKKSQVYATYQNREKMFFVPPELVRDREVLQDNGARYIESDGKRVSVLDFTDINPDHEYFAKKIQKKIRDVFGFKVH